MARPADPLSPLHQPSPAPERQERLRPSDLVRVEADALRALAARLDSGMQQPFAHAEDLLLATLDAGRRVVVTGLGKSGLIARKIAATLRSTGTPAHFLHPAEAHHGDLGMLTPGDAVIALSASGETEELLGLLETLRRLPTRLIAFSGEAASTLAKAADVFLDTSVSCEACPNNLAPTASTTVMLALGDALALSVAHRRGFAPEHFADLHPGGRLGRRLTRVRDLMHSGDALPSVTAATLLPEVMHEMSRKKLGMTTVVENSRLLGMVSDGDLRRLLERDGAASLNRTAAQIMNPRPLTVEPQAFATAALALMEQRKITSLVVVEPSTAEVAGVIHLHDLWALQLI